MSVIMLSGPVGAGKTTVARELVTTSPGPVVCIEGDKFWSFMVKEGTSMGPFEGFRLIMRSMMAAAIPYAMAGYEVVLDFSFPPRFLKKALAIVSSRDIPLDYVVIRPSLSVCEARAAARLEGGVADYAPYRNLYQSFDDAQQYIIYDDESAPGLIAAKIRKGLNEGMFRIQG